MVYDGQSNQVAALVAQELVEHVQGAVVLWNRARFDLDLAGAARPHGYQHGRRWDQTYGAPDGPASAICGWAAAVRLFARP